jgi:hypothetical protein
MPEVGLEALDWRIQELVLQISTDSLVGCAIDTWTTIGQLLNSTIRYAQDVSTMSRRGHNAVAKIP